jgi:4'-phosphopantetheinyl transferase
VTTDWAVPTAPPSLPADEIHVWRVPLALEDGAVSALAATLAPDERARADRFRLPRDRRRFIAARGMLRTLLGQIVGCDPSDIAFTYGPQGKPSLPQSESAPLLAFNVSHSGDLALIALRWGEAVGVDIEQIRPELEWRGIASRFYSPSELAWLQGLPISRQTDGFFRLWTRKEAYLKARGEGVWHELSRFDVTQSAVFEDGDFQDADWHLYDLETADDCKAAVCVQGAFPVLRLWQWERVAPD